MEQIRLTQYSHGAGCGCKISPKILSQILSSQSNQTNFPNLIIGNDNSDDAAVLEIDKGQLIISTTDFFMPIVDDPFDFGAIASVNAISDIYAMGGKPLMAISILGWPVDRLSPEVAKQVLEGARDVCKKAGIPLAGGHSIDTTEPIFGLAVTGITNKENLKTNAGATNGCQLYLTKPLGVGIMTTAQKRELLSDKDFKTVRTTMLKLNNIGEYLGQLDSVKAVTDVTGFGLLGHLIEMCKASDLSAEISFKDIPLLDGLDKYLQKKTFPGGTARNFESYAHHVSALSDSQKAILCDPQTSGGLLIAVEGEDPAFKDLLRTRGLSSTPIGKFIERNDFLVNIL